jgi:AcrR family transcriptional regulator
VTQLADTRSAILVTARELFLRDGYRATSMRRIAERLGISKPALYYHFPAKRVLLEQLIGPVVVEVERLLDRGLPDADDLDADGDESAGQAARWQLLEDYFEVLLRHRDIFAMIVRDLAQIAESPLGDRFVASLTRVNALVAGEGADVGRRILTAQIVAGLGDPIMLFPEESDAVLRAHVLRNARFLFDRMNDGGLPALPYVPARRGRPRGRGGGRPPALTTDQVRLARELYGTRQHTVEEIAERFGVSRATIYRQLAGA